MAIDLQTMVKPDEFKEMQRLVEINTVMKQLESEKKALSENIKKVMSSLNVESGSVGTATLTMVTSTRKTLSKNVHDKFVAELVGLGKQNLITTSIDPDLDAVMAEVDAGTLDKALVNKYVTVTPVKTLRCNI